jgi:hypothetical protein
VEAITLVTLLRVALRGAARLLLGARTPARLWLEGPCLRLEVELHVLGRLQNERSLTLPLGALAAVTLRRGPPPLRLVVGLGALCLGPALGSGALLRGLLAPGTAPGLLGLGLLLVALGLALEFLLERGAPGSGPTVALELRALDGRTLCLDAVEATSAEALARAIVGRLASLGPGGQAEPAQGASQGGEREPSPPLP